MNASYDDDAYRSHDNNHGTGTVILQWDVIEQLRGENNEKINTFEIQGNGWNLFPQKQQ